ncbi:MAG TPA: hypothetical protein VJC06_03140 [Candidatus Paceibacterota bacterium]
MQQKVILVGIGIVLAIVVGFIFIVKNISYAEQFNGQMLEVKNNSVFAQGFFVDLKTGKLSEENENVEIVTNSDTKILKTILYMPTQKELKESGGRWYPDKLKKEIKGVSIEELKNKQSFPITVKMKKVRQGINEFVATEIDFTEQIYSD